MTERKVRRPKSKSRSGLQVKIVELEYGCELRLSMEIFHAQGKYSSATSTLKMRGLVEDGKDPFVATKQLIKVVHDELDEALRERVERTLDDIESGSFR